jgi:hypothetical protein
MAMKSGHTTRALNTSLSHAKKLFLLGLARIVESVLSLSFRLVDQRIGVQFPVGAVIYLLTTVPRPAPGPAKPSIQWVLGSLPHG